MHHPPRAGASRTLILDKVPTQDIVDNAYVWGWCMLVDDVQVNWPYKVSCKIGRKYHLVFGDRFVRRGISAPPLLEDIKSSFDEGMYQSPSVEGVWTGSGVVISRYTEALLITLPTQVFDCSMMFPMCCSIKWISR